MSKTIEQINNEFRKRNNRNIKWGWFWIVYNIVVLALNAVFYFATGSVISLVASILIVMFTIGSVLVQRWNYQQRWYYLGSQR